MAMETATRKPTIEDVAARAGVSISTVSRVVNQSVPVDPATEGRVREAIAELGYRPNLLARSFRQRVTHTIGLLVPDISNPFFAKVARAIEDAGFAAGYSVVLCNSDLSEVKQATYIDVLLAKGVDGLILISTGFIPPESGFDLIDRIRGAGVPCVVVDRDLGELPIDQVMVDNHQGGYTVGQYLLRLGHRRFACVSGERDMAPSAGRIAGFLQALGDAEKLHPDVTLVTGNSHHEGGIAAAEELLRKGVEFTAVFAFNDLMAMGVIAALQRAGRRVPEDVSVVGFDDIPQTSAMFPSVTTIAQPTAELGQRSVELLLERIKNQTGPTQRLVLSTTLIERESCRAVPGIAAANGDGAVRSRPAARAP
jgi:LacI family transcriptional regulator